jgi:hypothetical protein
VPTGTAFLLLIGVGVEISLMFSIAGLALSKLLPPDPKKNILGVNNRRGGRWEEGNGLLSAAHTGQNL